MSLDNIALCDGNVIHARYQAGMDYFQIGDYSVKSESLHTCLQILAKESDWVAVTCYNAHEVSKLSGEILVRRAMMDQMEGVGGREIMNGHPELHLTNSKYLDINQKATEVSLGKYTMLKTEPWGSLIAYFVSGCWGWSGEEPDIAKQTKHAIKNSSSPLFSWLQEYAPTWLEPEN